MGGLYFQSRLHLIFAAVYKSNKKVGCTIWHCKISISLTANDYIDKLFFILLGPTLEF